jgi:hypothetical protein
MHPGSNDARTAPTTKGVIYDQNDLSAQVAVEQFDDNSPQFVDGPSCSRKKAMEN